MGPQSIQTFVHIPYPETLIATSGVHGKKSIILNLYNVYRGTVSDEFVPVVKYGWLILSFTLY